MKTEIELKPCPFCGDKKIEIIWYSLHKSCSVLCTNCKADIAPCRTEEQATEAWNKRTPGWISVKDRLPETRNPVLVTNEYGDFYLANCSSGIWTEHFREKANFISVTHWMPIPEPPEMKGE